MEREDFVRLKKVQEYKKKAIAEEEAKMKQLMAENPGAFNEFSKPSMLEAGKDKDDLFSS
jgi:hypothetical protein